MYLILVGGVVSTIKEGRNGLCLMKNKNSQETVEQCQSLICVELLNAFLAVHCAVPAKQ